MKTWCISQTQSFRKEPIRSWPWDLGHGSWLERRHRNSSRRKERLRTADVAWWYLQKGVLVTLKALNILTKLACLHMFTPEVCDFWWFLMVTPACGSWRFWSDRISNACRCTVRWLTDDSPMSWDSLQQGISLILMLSSVSCFYQGTTKNICRKLSMQSRKTESRCLANWPFFSSCEAQLLWLPQFHSIFTMRLCTDSPSLYLLVYASSS